MLSSKLIRWGGPASVLGGIGWILIWVHFLLTHGPTQTNQMGRLLTLTAYDSAKLLVIPLLLFLIGLLSLRVRQSGRLSHLGLAGYVLALLGFAFLIIGVVLEFWFMPWGVYREAYWYTPLGQIAGLIQLLSGFITSAGMILFGIAILRAKALSHWSWLPLILGLVLTASPWLHMTRYGGMFGLGWALLGYVLWSNQSKSAMQPKPAT